MNSLAVRIALWRRMSLWPGACDRAVYHETGPDMALGGPQAGERVRNVADLEPLDWRHQAFTKARNARAGMWQALDNRCAK